MMQYKMTCNVIKAFGSNSHEQSGKFSVRILVRQNQCGTVLKKTSISVIYDVYLLARDISP